ncbi:MAG TPA: heme biosynthesis HemY N-terminal domain-containing protein [Gammaproteobacteria bacterium]|nr:heme biosynthesis HemY N-terminal domain-containing protein [Gammaproteobacteria bacterium]
MKFLLTVFLALLFAAGIGAFAVNDSGYILITVADWTVQTSVVFFVTALVLMFIVLYIGLRSLFRLWNMPSDIKRWRIHRQQQLTEQYLTRGLLAMVEGRWKNAEDDLIKGAKYSETPLINYLCAARAAQRLGNIEHRDFYLRLAQAENPGTKAAIGLTQAELQINQQQTELALATLTHMDEEKSGQKQVKVMLLDTYTRLKAWNDVLKILPEIQRHKLLPRENIVARQLEAYAGLLREAGDAVDKNALERIWQEIPKKLRSELYLLEVYTMEKLRFADAADCEPLLRKVLKRQWDSEIVRLYGMVQGADPGGQLSFAEGLLSGHARDSVLLLSLGRLSMRNGLWGKAESYLKESIQAHPLPETYRELAILLEKQGDYSAAASYYQQGLSLATELPRHDGLRMLAREDEEAATAGARQVV